jgi:SHS2 domain-containing protein
MPYRFLEDVAIADVAFEARGGTLAELFKQSALALVNTMVQDPAKIRRSIEKKIEVTAESAEMLLFHFLQDLIFYKDAELLLFNGFLLTIARTEGRWRLRGTLSGENISSDRHELLADVKAVSLHNYTVHKIAGGWQAEVILDV